MYGTLSEANTYFESRLYTTAWDDASSVNKNIALEEATARIERLRFSGNLVEDDQELEFPRYYGDEVEGDEVIPEDIEKACYEIAFALLDGVDPDIEFENLSVASQGYSSVRSANFALSPQPHIAAGIPSATAWRYLMQYLADDRTIKTHRVS